MVVVVVIMVVVVVVVVVVWGCGDGLVGCMVGGEGEVQRDAVPEYLPT